MFSDPPTDISHGSIYGKCQGCLEDRGFWGNVENVSDADLSPDDRDARRMSGMLVDDFQILLQDHPQVQALANPGRSGRRGSVQQTNANAPLT